MDTNGRDVIYERHQVGLLLDEGSTDTLRAALKPRQMWMIALGGAIGSGLLVGTGPALSKGGPLGLLLGYIYVGTICYFLLTSLGEICAFLPHKKGFAGYAARFWHPAAGFAMGWIYTFQWWVALPGQIIAANVIIQDWESAIKCYYWAWAFIIGIVLINFFGVRIFGETEFWLSSFKLLILMALAIFGIIINLGGNPNHEIIGFHYWIEPGPMGTTWGNITTNLDPSRLMSIGSASVAAIGSYSGSELIGVTVGEAENPRKTVPMAIRGTLIRIFVFYIGTVFVIGLIAPSDFTMRSNTQTRSPWVFAAESIGLHSLHPVINAAAIIFLFSTANSDLYIASRSVYALSLLNQAPKVLRKVNGKGVPVTALVLSTIFACAAVVDLGITAGKILATITVLYCTSAILTWICIFYTYLCFQRGLHAQGIDRHTLSYRAPLQPYASYFGIAGLSTVLIFFGMDLGLAPNTSKSLAICSYLPFLVFVLLFFFWRWKKGETGINPLTMDLTSGRRQFDEEEIAYELAKREARPRGKRPFLAKVLELHLIL